MRLSNPLSGSRKVRGDWIRWKLPLRIQHLEGFIDTAVKSQSYDNFLFATTLVWAFYACHQVGELVITNDCSLFDWHKIIK